MAATLELLRPHAERLKGRIGTTGATVVRRVEEGALVKFALATGQTDPLYVDPEAARRGPYGAVLASPTYLSTFTNGTMGDGFFDFDLPVKMFLHTDDAVELGAPIVAGDEISATARYADVYLRQGRSGAMLFQVAELTMTNQRDEHVATLRVGSVSFDSPGA